MVGEFLPQHEKPKTPGKNRAQEWLSPEFMKRFSEISDNRRKELREGAGDIALGLTEKKPGLTETQGDVVEALAPLAMLVSPGAPITKLFAVDVAFTGSPYDKSKERKKAA
jgi:hypothetical protein